ncbi:unnamed protein product [Protopolystoma xenopodis]|uniref:PDZ domain-containing protein n=1 Tax=Protopolystoma xenopodis TaxID=117903 RepID=A0A3S5A9W6_9PLAT|nr:unnamed protein product [Protopolystoma xenopodis]
MPLYPTLEDLKVTELLTHQNLSDALASGCNVADFRPNYGSFMGLDLTAFSYDSEGGLVVTESNSSSLGIVCAPVSGNALVTKEAITGIKHGLRRVVVTKNHLGKLGIQLRSVDTGVFICFIQRDSSAAKSGLRFGDQVVEINDVYTAGMKEKKAMALIKNSQSPIVSFVVRDR